MFFMLQRCFCFGWSTSPSSKCLFGLGEATKQGGAKLTFCLLMDLSGKKGKFVWNYPLTSNFEEGGKLTSLSLI